MWHPLLPCRREGSAARKPSEQRCRAAPGRPAADAAASPGGAACAEPCARLAAQLPASARAGAGHVQHRAGAPALVCAWTQRRRRRRPGRPRSTAAGQQGAAGCRHPGGRRLRGCASRACAACAAGHAAAPAPALGAGPPAARSRHAPRLGRTAGGQPLQRLSMRANRLFAGRSPDVAALRRSSTRDKRSRSSVGRLGRCHMRPPGRSPKSLLPAMALLR